MSIRPPLTLIQASATDNARILAFQASHRMAGKLALHFDRSPDFAALYRLHSPLHQTWLAQESDGEHAIKGIGSFVVRPGYLDGQVEPVAYLGDLRVVPDRRLSRDWSAAMRERLRANEQAFGVRYSYCCVIRDNLLARRALLTSQRQNRLILTLWRGYSNVSILARRPFARPRSSSELRVRRASSSDIEPLREFLDNQSRMQAFGCVFDAPMFAARLEQWPGFGIESFLLAVDAHGRIRGCLAAWDASAVKRVVLEKLPLPLALLRLGFNACSPLLGRPRIAAPGAPLADVWLTHVQIAERNPDTFALLLDAAWQSLKSAYPTVSLCLYDGDPLWPAMRAYVAVKVAMDLYTVAAGTHLPPLQLPPAAIPGFEIYLV